MKAWKTLAVAGALTTMLGGCMHHTSDTVSTGLATVDARTAARTALLRVDNSSRGEVRVYMKMPGTDANFVARAMPGDVRTTVLDPNLFPTNSISFELREMNGTAPRTLGPFKVNKNETVDLVVPSDLTAARATIHASAP